MAALKIDGNWCKDMAVYHKSEKFMRTNYALGVRLILSTLAVMQLPLMTALAQGTAFSYQGQLSDSGQSANGIYDLRFTIYDALDNGHIIAGPIVTSGVGVTHGLFTVALDFGSGVFTGPGRWLHLEVRTNGTGLFSLLLPRQQLLAAPYAMQSTSASNLLGTVSATQVSGTLPPSALAGYSGTVAFTNAGNTFSGSFAGGFTGSFSGNGAGLTNLQGIPVWQVVTGTIQLAQTNTGYIATNTSQVTINLPLAPAIGSTVRVSGAGAGGWRITQNAGQSIQLNTVGASYTNWINLTNWVPTGIAGRNYSSIASSADGTKLAAVVYQAGIFTSANSGTNWAQSAATVANWVSIASSADGTHLVAAANPGGIYVSSNSGGTWTLSAGVANWSAVAASADGTKLAAVVYGGSIYTSTNSGTNWAQTSSPIYPWVSIASSTDGAKLAAAAYGAGIFVSADGGNTWAPNTAPVLNWWSVASSGDGTRLVAVVKGGGIYVSRTSGATWSPTSAPSQNWYSVASSADGTKLVAAVNPGGLYTSSDGGITWALTGATSSYWDCVASSADGTKLVAGVYGGGIYTAQAIIRTTTTPGTAGNLSGTQGAAIELQYVGNGLFLPLSYTGTLSAY
jgi:hypothetical protein